MAGLDVDAINQSIRPIANIALVGDTELGETADLVTNIMTGYGIAPERMRRATDIMTMTFTSANTTLNEIAEAYKYSASLLHEGGVSFEEATAAMGVLGNAGIKGSQAGTSMRTILANIVNPRSTKRNKAWEEVGVKRFDEMGRCETCLTSSRICTTRTLMCRCIIGCLTVQQRKVLSHWPQTLMYGMRLSDETLCLKIWQSSWPMKR